MLHNQSSDKSNRFYIGLAAALGLSLCALEYINPHQNIFSSPGSDPIEIDIYEPVNIPVTLRSFPEPPKVVQPQLAPKIEVATIVPTTIMPVPDPIAELPDFNFDIGDVFFMPDTTVQEPIAFFEATEKPEFPGGEEAMYKFLGKHLRYPKEDLRRNIEGIVYVQFVVGKDGAINPNSIQIKRTPSKSIAKEATRVIELMPKWKPGKQRSKKVPVIFMLPVRFDQQ